MYSKVVYTLAKNIKYIIFIVFGSNFPQVTVQLQENHFRMFWELFSWKISFQLHERMFSELILQ